MFFYALGVCKNAHCAYRSKVQSFYCINNLKVTDPPYNTGSDLLYADNYVKTINDYNNLNHGEYNFNGNRIIKNADSNGRFHTDWLNMIYPRLKLAKDLLSEDGIICISMDENEEANLEKICDEIFGKINAVGKIIRKTKSMTADKGTGFNLQHEVLLMYSKNKNKVTLLGEKKAFDKYSNPDNDINGDWCSGDPSAKSGGKTTYFGIENPYTKKIDFPPKGRYWAFSKETLKRYIESGKIKFKESYGENERGFIFKRYKKDSNSLNDPVNSLFSVDNKYMNQTATIEMKEIFEENIFSYPKPVEFIKKLIYYSNTELVLDFFSGSATTAHAVMSLNAEDGGNRRFIMVQWPERINEKTDAYKSGYKYISEIGKERIRRVGKQIKEKTGANIDYGFRVLKCDSSNMKDVYYNPEEYQAEMFNDLTDNIKEDRTSEDLLFQVMLDLGVELSSKIEEKEICGKKVFNVAKGFLIACFDTEVTEDIVIEIAKEKPYYFVMRDSSMATDSVATNFEQTFKTYSPDTIRKVI